MNQAVKTMCKNRTRRNRHRRAGQTLTEYALLLAYISVVLIQVLDNLSVYTTETLMEADCGLLIAQTHNPNLSAAEDQAVELIAVANFIVNYNYGHFDAQQIATIESDTYSHMANIILSSQ